MERVAEKAGLNFIVNVVIDSRKNIVKVLSGDSVKAHREAIKYARPIYERKIPQLADIVVVSAYPADIDYWQGDKALAYAQRAAKEGGTIILVGQFPEGISSTHPEEEKYANRPYNEIKKLFRKGEIKDGVCVSSLLLTALILTRVNVTCVSNGMSVEQKAKLNFEHAKNIDKALKFAFEKQGKGAKIGIINYGGDVLPRYRDKQYSICQSRVY